MSEHVETFAAERSALAHSAALARLYGELDDIEATLVRLPLWEPARELQAEVTWVRGQLARISEAWDRRLVVAIVGPSGAGKSTLLNALAGRELSAARVNGSQAQQGGAGFRQRQGGIDRVS